MLKVRPLGPIQDLFVGGSVSRRNIGIFFAVLACLLVVARWLISPQPLASGRVVSGMIWENPRSAPSNQGHGILPDARVEVYDQVIVVMNADGTKEIAPHDRVTGLKLK